MDGKVNEDEVDYPVEYVTSSHDKILTIADRKLTRFFEDPKHQSDVTALIGLWTALANTLKGERCLEWSERLREQLRGRSIESYGDPDIQDGLIAGNNRMAKEIAKLIPKVFKKELKQLPEYHVIKKSTGRRIRREFVSSFPLEIYTPKLRTYRE